MPRSFPVLLLAALMAVSIARAEEPSPPGFPMRDFFPLEEPGVTWRYEDGERWVELTSRGATSLEGEPALALDAVDTGTPVGRRYYTASGPLAALYVEVPAAPMGIDFREDPLSYATGPRAYVGDRLTAAPRSFMGGMVRMTSEVLGLVEVETPYASFPEALRFHTTMTYVPTGEVSSEFDSYYVEGVGMVWTRGTEVGPDGVARSFDQRLVEIRRATSRR